MGVARTLLYQGRENQPLYGVMQDGRPDCTGRGEEETFFREYRVKLSRLEERFYTSTGRALAAARQKACHAFTQALKAEIAEDEEGREEIDRRIQRDG